MKFSFLIVLLMINSWLYSQERENALAFLQNWDIQFLNDSHLDCGEYITMLDDEFEGSSLDEDVWAKVLYGGGDPNNFYGRIHHDQFPLIFLDENVTVSDGKLKLTVKQGDFEWQGARRNLSGGTIWAKEKFNLGKYEIRCKLPPKEFWTAFWLWHHEEIDIIDVANVERYIASFINDAENLIETVEVLNPDEGENGWNIYTLEWTPYRATILQNGVIIQEIYKYYTLNDQPLKVECGENVSKGLYKVNPIFPTIRHRWFAPTAWITVHGECTNYDPATRSCEVTDPSTLAVLPYSMEIDYIKVDERLYKKVELIEECTQDCANEKCFTVNSSYFNEDMFRFGNPSSDTRINNISTSVESEITGLNSFCVTRNVDDRLQLILNVEFEDGVQDIEFYVDYSLQPQVFEYYSRKLERSVLCIMRESICDSYEIIPTPDNSQIEYHESTLNLDSYILQSEGVFCKSLTVNFENCDGLERDVEFNFNRDIDGFIYSNDFEGVLLTDYNVVDDPTVRLELKSSSGSPVKQWQWEKVSGPRNLYNLYGNDFRFGGYTDFLGVNNDPLYGSFTVTFKDGCRWQKSVYIAYFQPYKLYENPAHDFLTIELIKDMANDPNSYINRIQVYRMHDASETIDIMGLNADSYSLNTSSLDSGTHLVKITDASGKVFNYSVLVSH